MRNEQYTLPKTFNNPSQKVKFSQIKARITPLFSTRKLSDELPRFAHHPTQKPPQFSAPPPPIDVTIESRHPRLDSGLQSGWWGGCYADKQTVTLGWARGKAPMISGFPPSPRRSDSHGSGCQVSICVFLCSLKN